VWQKGRGRNQTGEFTITPAQVFTNQCQLIRLLQTQTIHHDLAKRFEVVSCHYVLMHFTTIL
jgi:hypothetical protein